MASLDDFFSKEEIEEDFGEEIFMDSRCEKCNLPTDKSYLSKDKKIITFICPANHIQTIDTKKMPWLR